MTGCVVCMDLAKKRAVYGLATHIEQQHKILFGAGRRAREMVFGTRGTKE